MCQDKYKKINLKHKKCQMCQHCQLCVITEKLVNNKLCNPVATFVAKTNYLIYPIERYLLHYLQWNLKKVIHPNITAVGDIDLLSSHWDLLATSFFSTKANGSNISRGI